MKSVFLAGATGAVGFPLVKLLVQTGRYRVFGCTRDWKKAEILQSLGARPIVVDVYDCDKLKHEMQWVKPEIVIHQLTDLPFGLPKESMEVALPKNARIRDEGTRNLIEAMKSVGSEQFLVQSIGFMYSEGPTPHSEEEMSGSGNLRNLEEMALSSCEQTKIMRYGRFYGPRTGFDKVELPCRVHVEAAAFACVLLLTQGNWNIYNVCEDSEYASNQRILSDTDWDPDFRI